MALKIKPTCRTLCSDHMGTCLKVCPHYAERPIIPRLTRKQWDLTLAIIRTACSLIAATALVLRLWR